MLERDLTRVASLAPTRIAELSATLLHLVNAIGPYTSPIMSYVEGRLELEFWKNQRRLAIGVSDRYGIEFRQVQLDFPDDEGVILSDDMTYHLWSWLHAQNSGN